MQKIDKSRIVIKKRSPAKTFVIESGLMQTKIIFDPGHCIGQIKREVTK